MIANLLSPLSSIFLYYYYSILVMLKEKKNRGAKQMFFLCCVFFYKNFTYIKHIYVYSHQYCFFVLLGFFLHTEEITVKGKENQHKSITRKLNVELYVHTTQIALNAWTWCSKKKKKLY